MPEMNNKSVLAAPRLTNLQRTPCAWICDTDAEPLTAHVQGACKPRTWTISCRHSVLISSNNAGYFSLHRQPP